MQYTTMELVDLRHQSSSDPCRSSLTMHASALAGVCPFTRSSSWAAWLLFHVCRPEWFPLWKWRWQSDTSGLIRATTIRASRYPPCQTSSSAVDADHAVLSVSFSASDVVSPSHRPPSPAVHWVLMHLLCRLTIHHDADDVCTSAWAARLRAFLLCSCSTPPITMTRFREQASGGSTASVSVSSVQHS